MSGRRRQGTEPPRQNNICKQAGLDGRKRITINYTCVRARSFFAFRWHRDRRLGGLSIGPMALCVGSKLPRPLVDALSDPSAGHILSVTLKIKRLNDSQLNKFVYIYKARKIAAVVCGQCNPTTFGDGRTRIEVTKR